ncbi:hypothetical protein BC835DRAFT_1277238 [Cytidiella melzeri]|nr:hypothetical protein BC835DRAFT_1277238 [Cytidiella melzeri]
MTVSRALHLTTRNRRKTLTYIFGATAFASILTVAASDVLPCPARPSGSTRHADATGGGGGGGGAKTIMEKKPRRWIEENRPSSPTHPV